MLSLMRHSTLKIGCLLYGSGLCALVYQTTWFREFRLIFGASTAASAAVLAIFMGGLGFGSWLFGPRVDRAPRPLDYYASLELLVAASAALTPALIALSRTVYVFLGGSTVLGVVGGTTARLVLSAVVLGAPTILMGGTLPAAARAVETDGDESRRNLAVLYGMNALGAVTGALLSTFVLFERFGNHRTLWWAAALNVCVFAVARLLARSGASDPIAPLPPGQTDNASQGLRTPPLFVLFAAAGVGFAFFLMEIVWYRMLAPILGGSSFTFGLILAVALLGIGLGGAAYAMLAGSRPTTLTAFALTCALEAFFIAAPYALGDRIALLAALMRPLGNVGFYGHVFAWTIVSLLVVFPASFLAGLQFPVLISLLGRGREAVGRHVGHAYAANTLGAIAGSLAGGFGILPLLTAQGTWKLVVVMLAAIGAAAMALDIRQIRRSIRHAPAAVAAFAAIALLLALGPTAAWRHSPIGAGRVHLADSSRNDIHNWINERRRDIGWQADGRESSVALTYNTGYAFMVNGKVDGNARADAGTQIMGGLLGGLLHPNPTSALVIGLGTGSSAGWLGSIPSVDRVDVVELEPSILHVADACTPVNRDVLHNPKVHVTIDDAREVLITTPRRYDVIFSEPSNPYRAGIASLYTQDFYRSAASRLSEGGLFCQWLQTYEVDAETVRTVVATLASVFPAVEIWQTEVGDLILVGSAAPVSIDADAMRKRIAQEPFRSALAYAWRASDLEGLLAHFVARDGFARHVLEGEGTRVNTDDRNLVEFGFARTVGRSGYNKIEELLSLVSARDEGTPDVTGDVDWDLVALRRVEVFVVEDREAPIPDDFPKTYLERARNLNTYAGTDYDPILRSISAGGYVPGDLLEIEMFAVVFANAGDARAETYIRQLRPLDPVEADALMGQLRARQGRLDEAADALVAAFEGYRSDPWAVSWFMHSATQNAALVAQQDDTDKRARRLYDALAKPFCMYLSNDARRSARVEIAKSLDRALYTTLSRDAIQDFEPYVPWNEEFLTARANCYTTVKDPRSAAARRDLDEFRSNEPPKYDK